MDKLAFVFLGIGVMLAINVMYFSIIRPLINNKEEKNVLLLYELACEIRKYIKENISPNRKRQIIYIQNNDELFSKITESNFIILCKILKKPEIFSFELSNDHYIRGVYKIEDITYDANNKKMFFIITI